MATTKIWPIKSGHLGKVIDYVSNSMKTDEHNFSERELTDLYNAIHYVEDAEKTMSAEKHLFVSGVNCDPSNAKAEWMETKERFGKTGGILAHHAYQSFKPGEVTPELAHRIGVELARNMWGNRFEVIVATHLNAGTIHDHFCQGLNYTITKREYKSSAFAKYVFFVRNPIIKNIYIMRCITMDDKYYLQDIFGREDEKNIFITSFQNYPTTKNHVYYFHGESGVGKTTLFDYLCNLINLQNESDHFFLPIIASKSLTQKTGTRHLYKRIKESNEKIYFRFPRYEIACRFLYRRLNDNEFKIEKTENGVDAIIDEIKNVVEFEKPVDTFIVNMIIRCFYKSIITLVSSETQKKQERQLRDFVQELQGLNINDIENKLTDYLIDDINQSLELTSFLIQIITLFLL